MELPNYSETIIAKVHERKKGNDGTIVNKVLQRSLTCEKGEVYTSLETGNTLVFNEKSFENPSDNWEYRLLAWKYLEDIELKVK